MKSNFGADVESQSRLLFELFIEVLRTKFLPLLLIFRFNLKGKFIFLIFLTFLYDLTNAKKENNTKLMKKRNFISDINILAEKYQKVNIFEIKFIIITEHLF